MERLIYRSTSIAHLQAELRHRDLMAAAQRSALARAAGRTRPRFRLPFIGGRDERRMGG